ncbi:MAG TPA: hypothetical protein VIH86_13210 [Puia sp.]
MKKIVFSLSFFVFVFLFASCGPSYVVRDRPAEVVYLRPAPPSPDHVWVSGDWVWANGKYVWHEGHYETRRVGYRWFEGHWINSRGGWVWIRGRWRSY